MKSANMFVRLGEIIKDNSPMILTGVAIGGVASTVILGIRATPKAMMLLDDYEYNEVQRELTSKEEIQVAWKCYIPTAIMGVITISAILGTSKIHQTRNAALAGMYSLAEKGLREYQSKVIEVIGEKKAQQVKDDIQKDLIARSPIGNKEIIITGKGPMVCYEAMSGRYFKSDIDNIRKAINELNRHLLGDTYMFVTLNEMYYELGLSNTKLGELVGWHVDDGIIEANFSSQLTDEDTPCLVLDFNVSPKYLYD